MLGLRSSIWIPIVLGLAAGACRKPAAPVPPCLAQVELTFLGDAQDPVTALGPAEKQALTAALRQSLEKSVPACQGPARARLGAGFLLARSQESTEGKPVLRLKGGLRIGLKDAPADWKYYEENVATEGTVPLEAAQEPKRQSAVQRATQALLVDLAKSYRNRLAAWKASPAELHSLLATGGEEEKLEAIAVVRARGVTAEIPRLLELLVDDNERLRDAALGACLQLRVREAVPILTKSREMKDGREMQKILDALAELGGAEAKAYLSFVAETHDSEPIRAVAAGALRRLLQSDKKTPTQ
jgi:hypothetical protein